MLRGQSCRQSPVSGRCYPPPLLGFLRAFIQAGPPKYQAFVLQRFDRTVAMGVRSKPITSLDIEVGEA